MKIIEWGFPKEGQDCRWFDLWKAWLICLYTEERGGFNLELIIPVLQITFRLTENKTPWINTGWYRFDITIKSLSIIFIEISLPLGKWRKSYSMTDRAMDGKANER